MILEESSGSFLTSIGDWIQLLGVVLAIGMLLLNYVTFIFGSPELRVIRQEMGRMHDRLQELVEKVGR
jgi:hypothetical protein